MQLPFFYQMSPSPSIPDPRQDYKGYQQSLFKALVSATAASNAISTEDIGFYRSLDRQFAKDLDICGSKVLQIANRIAKHAALDTGSQIQSFEDVDDVVDQFDNVVDVVDSLLERAVSRSFDTFLNASMYVTYPLGCLSGRDARPSYKT